MAVKTHSAQKTSTRNFNVANTFNPALPPTVLEYLVVAGGGSGAINSSSDVKGAGGGAGGLLTGNTNIAFTTYTVVVGTGGNGQNSGEGLYGSNSSFIGTGVSIVSYGGGRGGWVLDSAGSGGSGGGTTGSTYLGAGQNVGKGVYPGSSFVSAARQGYDGAQGTGNLGGTACTGGGGGGAGGAGSGATGGTGYTTTISGSSVTYASGGAGGTGNNYPPGTKSTTIGGGGNGGSATSPGVANYSQGGGDGAVIVRYPNTFPAASATTGTVSITNSGGFRTYNFTSSGTITFN